MSGLIIGGAIPLSFLIGFLALYGTYKGIKKTERVLTNYKLHKQEILDIKREASTLKWLAQLSLLPLYYQREVIRNMRAAGSLPSYVSGGILQATDIILIIFQMQNRRKQNVVHTQMITDRRLTPIAA